MLLSVSFLEQCPASSGRVPSVSWTAHNGTQRTDSASPFLCSLCRLERFSYANAKLLQGPFPPPPSLQAAPNLSLCPWLFWCEGGGFCELWSWMGVVVAWGTSLCGIYMARGDPVCQKGRESSFVISIDSLMKMSLVNRGSWHSLLAIPLKGIKQTGTLMLPLWCQKAKSSSGQMKVWIWAHSKSFCFFICLGSHLMVLGDYQFCAVGRGHHMWCLGTCTQSTPALWASFLALTLLLTWIDWIQIKENKKGESQMPRQGVGVGALQSLWQIIWYHLKKSSCGTSMNRNGRIAPKTADA